MNPDTKTLNKFLKVKKTLWIEQRTPENRPLINLLLDLCNNNYKFTETQITMFITQAMFKNKGFQKFAITTDPDSRKIIHYILTTGPITTGHVDSITVEGRSDNRFKIWYDTLFEIKYNFTMNQYINILSSHGGHFKYQVSDLQAYDTLHPNIIFVGLQNCVYGKCKHMLKCIELIEQTEKFNIFNLQIIFNCVILLSYHNNLKGNVIKLLSALYKNITPEDKDAIMQYILNVSSSLNRYQSPKINNHIIIPTLNLMGYNEQLIDYYFSNSHEHNIILTLMNLGYKPTIDNINTLIQNDVTYFSISDNYPNISLFILNGPVIISIIDLMEIATLVPNIQTLNTLCKKEPYVEVSNNILILLNKYNIIPNEETLKIAIITNNQPLIMKILAYKLTPTVDIIYDIITTKTKKIVPYRWDASTIELLLIHGLNLKDTDVKCLLENGFFLQNLERFNIPYDEYIYFRCYLYDYYPEEYIQKFIIPKSILEMHELCKKPHLEYNKLTNFLIDNDIKLDRFALENLFNNNKFIYQSICRNNYGCCLSIISILKDHINMCKFEIAKEYNITHNDMFKGYDNYIY